MLVLAHKRSGKKVAESAIDSQVLLEDVLGGNIGFLANIVV
jgi:hypothetical protein